MTRQQMRLLEKNSVSFKPILLYNLYRKRGLEVESRFRKKRIAI